MGKGVGYPYSHGVIAAPDAFTLKGGVRDDEGTIITEDEDRYEELVESGNPLVEDEFDSIEWSMCLQDIVHYFDAWELNSKIYEGRESYLFAENDRLYIGIDSSGESSCIFLKPKVYIGKDWEEVEYNIDRDAKKGFNRLARNYGYTFHKIGSAYCLGKQLNSKDLYS